MPQRDDLARLDAIGQAELVRQGEISAPELVDAAISRIDRLNPELNAVITPMFDQARQAVRGDLPAGPLSGVPFLLKDLGAVTWAGVRMASGTSLLRDNIPDHDSYLVQRYRQAGLIVLGKTNAPELGLLPLTEPRLFGPTRNPWSPDHTPGGSSGGSAAAVAAGMVPAAHGNDGGGSIRIPAACCGLFGLKPTRARSTLGPDCGESHGGVGVEHALTRSVRDSAALLDVIAGPAPGDPYCAPPPARPFVDEVGADPGALRIAFSTRAPRGSDVHPDCVQAVLNAAQLCEDLGHSVVEAAPAMDASQFEQMFLTVFASGLAAGVGNLAAQCGREVTEDDLEPVTWEFCQTGKACSASEYLRALDGLQAIARALAEFLGQYDLWLTPTLGQPPLPLGSVDLPRDRLMTEGTERILSFISFTPIANTCGVPAMSVPLHWSAEGLPIGTQFIAPYGDEATLFRLAAQLEEARPWAARLPPIFASD